MAQAQTHKWHVGVCSGKHALAELHAPIWPWVKSPYPKMRSQNCFDNHCHKSPGPMSASNRARVAKSRLHQEPRQMPCWRSKALCITRCAWLQPALMGPKRQGTGNKHADSPIRAVGNGIHCCDTTERASQKRVSSYSGGFPCITDGEKPLDPTTLCGPLAAIGELDGNLLSG